MEAHRQIKLRTATVRRLKVIAGREDRTMTDMLEEAVEDLEAKYPVRAKESPARARKAAR